MKVYYANAKKFVLEGHTIDGEVADENGILYIVGENGKRIRIQTKRARTVKDDDIDDSSSIGFVCLFAGIGFILSLACCLYITFNQ